MHNLVLLLMGGVGFIFFKNNKKILLKNIFFQKDVDLNSKKQCGVTVSPFWMKSLYSVLAPFLVSSLPCPLYEAKAMHLALPGLESCMGAGTEHTGWALPVVWPACLPREPSHWSP